MASIRDVAQKAGVSPTTVSRTFRSPDLLTQQTQHRVLDAAQQLGYRPRQIRSRGSKTQQQTLVGTPAVTGAIGFQFFADLPEEVLTSNMFYAPMLAGAQAEATALGLHLLVHTTDRHTLVQGLPRMVDERAIEGMLLVGTAEREVVDTFAKHVPHVVLVDNTDETGVFESVVSDGFGGALAATRYLLESGHRRIGFFQARVGIATFQERLRGYWCALHEGDIQPDPALVIGPKAREEEWSPALVERLLACMAGADRPTALIAANDDCAVFAQRFCRQAGLRVPDDLSLIGFDDMPFTAHTDPPLTTVRVDKELMGRLAVRRLHARIEAAKLQNEAPPPPVQHSLPVVLVKRESCRSLPD